MIENQTKSIEYMKSIWKSIKQKSKDQKTREKSLKINSNNTENLRYSTTFDNNLKKPTINRTNSSKISNKRKFNFDLQRNSKKKTKENQSNSTFKLSIDEMRVSDSDLSGQNNENFNSLNLKNTANISSNFYSNPTNEVKTVKNGLRNPNKRKTHNFNFKKKILNDSIKVKSYLETQEKEIKAEEETQKFITQNKKLISRLERTREIIKDLQNNLTLKEMEISELKSCLKDHKRMLNTVKSVNGDALALNIENERLRKDILSLITCFSNISKNGKIDSKSKFMFESNFTNLKESFEYKGEMRFLEIERSINNGGESFGNKKSDFLKLEDMSKRNSKRGSKKKIGRRASRCYSCSSEAETKKKGGVIEEYFEDFIRSWIPKEVHDVLEKVRSVMKLREKKFQTLKVSQFSF